MQVGRKQILIVQSEHARSRRVVLQWIGQLVRWACGANAEGDNGWVRGNLRQCDWWRVPSAFIVLRCWFVYLCHARKWRLVDPDGKGAISKGTASVREQEGMFHPKTMPMGVVRRPPGTAWRPISAGIPNPISAGIPKLQHDDHPWRSPNVSTHTSGAFIGGLCIQCVDVRGHVGGKKDLHMSASTEARQTTHRNVRDKILR